ncbi:MAG: hypothetical protein HOO06_06870 [Bdellovibrionaceae bacterium]|jgi:DNA polymerase III subunit epsilon|nr:hypothetical protein [Pseudobdellovibrionaceae bacterium]
MSHLFVESLYNEDKSVTIKEFTELPPSIFDKEVKMNPDIGVCSILDTETTGLDYKKDEIIEIAIRKWLYHKKDHYLIKPIEVYSSLNEPIKNEISGFITKITGITNEDVKGKKIDWDVVSKLISESDFVLAHNAGFDRPMIESVPQLKEVSQSVIWTCSLKQVNWAELGFISTKQEVLGIFHGFYYTAHKALMDVDALANILLQGNYLKTILEDAKTKHVEVDCVQAPFATKDLLKNNGFSWNAPKRFWTRSVSEPELEAMKLFLSDEIYPQGFMKAEFTEIALNDRFKA